MLVKIPVSVGELIDKITILEIKLEQAKNHTQKNNIEKELNFLNKKISKIDYPIFYYHSLKSINLILWHVEDLIRVEEKFGEFGENFILYARMIYMYNDARARVKKEINRLTDSEIVEEKIFS